MCSSSHHWVEIIRFLSSWSFFFLLQCSFALVESSARLNIELRLLCSLECGVGGWLSRLRPHKASSEPASMARELWDWRDRRRRDSCRHLNHHGASNPSTASWPVKCCFVFTTVGFLGNYLFIHIFSIVFMISVWPLFAPVPVFHTVWSMVLSIATGKRRGLHRQDHIRSSWPFSETPRDNLGIDCLSHIYWFFTPCSEPQAWLGGL